jgi:carbamoyltransferase
MGGVLGFLGHLPARLSPEQETFTGWESGWYHNSSAALVDATGIVAAAEEERFTRVKNTGVFPLNAIGYCLAQTSGPLDAIAFGEQGGFGPLREPTISEHRIRALAASCGVPETVPIRLIDHHTSHAYSAASASGFDDALVLTLDGFGDGISGSVRILNGGKLAEPHRTIPAEASLGMFYASLLSYLGYQDGDEYKVMGLAPYGDPARFRRFVADQFELADDGAFTIACHDRRQMGERLLALGPARTPGGEFDAHHADVAAAFQDALEHIVVHLLEAELAATAQSRVCFAGGVAHNSSMMGKLAARGIELADVFVQPAADDSGIALGAACAVVKSLSAEADTTMPHTYFGPAIGKSDVAAVRHRWRAALDVTESADPAADVARLLFEGNIVASARGRMEFGPRALGHRSIYADPRPRQNQERVNRVVKSRESFRPFAPVVIAAAAEQYFDLDFPVDSYRFMTLVGRVKDRYREALGAVTHVDGTARVQTVTAERNPHLHDLLSRFAELSGMPILLNTSLNNHREPIVCTAGDAVDFLLTSGVDYLELEGDIMRRRATSGPRELLDAARVILRSGVVSLAHVDATGAMRYKVVGPDRRPREVSRDTYLFLDSGCWPDPPDQVAGELWQLWVDRLINVFPG